MSSILNGEQPPKKRALILAGGGMKVAFQAGVLQVLLDEAELPFDRFDHVDGCSGGVFNLAMWCQGYSGKEIADKWRGFPAKKGLELNWRKYWKLTRADSIFAMDRFRRNILRKHWGLEWERIKRMDGRVGQEATFNAFDFTRQRLVVREAREMEESFLVACVALPRWFPPVSIDGRTYIDAVFVTDANLEEALERGADELWVIWTVSRRGRWTNGFIGNYFGVIEASANGHFARVRDRIDENNKAIADGKPKKAEFGRRIELKVIAGEVPLHYLLNINPDRFTQAVELGVGAARQWCVQNRIPVNPITPDHKIPVRPMPPDRGNLVSLSFKERMDGAIAAGVTDYEQGNRGGEPVTLRLKMYADDLDVFISDPDHTARVTGTLELGPRLGGTATVSDGWFNLMPFSGDIDERWMFYWLPLDGTTRVLSGYKKMRDDPEEDLGELWRETTTLFTHILEDALGPPPRDALIEAFSAGRPEPTGDVVAAGMLRVDLKDFAGLLSSISADGPSRRAEASAKARFSAFFVGGLWDVYASRLLPASPF